MATKTADFREDAQLVIDVLREKEQVRLDYSAASVSWLDAYIEQHRPALDAGDKRLLQEKFGAYLGETMRRANGGQWVIGSDDRWIIAFGEREKASPFEWIAEHLDHHTALTRHFEHLPGADPMRN